MTGGKFKLSKSFRKALSAAKDEAARFGATVEFEPTWTRHPKFTVRLNEQERTSPFSSTPSNCEMQPNYIRQRVRQLIRDMTA